ncbi:hypothetical protein [Haematomicrobium sanguinis]|uniref:hypothetical protein n=1 Tax=Haematomicrobium sanguinis TaxID=479106 RepID=UPI00047B219F|nr:hypothetical protein [Haematomicrobium sanguinis]
MSAKLQQRLLLGAGILCLCLMPPLIFWTLTASTSGDKVLSFCLLTVTFIVGGVSWSQWEVSRKRNKGPHNEESVEYQSLLLSRARAFPHVYVAATLMFFSIVVLTDQYSVRMACNLLFIYALVALGVTQFTARKSLGADTRL